MKPEAEALDLTWLAWTGFGLAGAGLVLGGVAGGIALSEYQQLEDECPTLGCSQDQIDEARTIAHVGTAGFVVAGVGAAVGLVALLISDDADPAVGAQGTLVRIRF